MVIGVVLCVGLVVVDCGGEIDVQLFVFLGDVGFVYVYQWCVDVQFLVFYVGFGCYVGELFECFDEGWVVIWIVGVIYCVYVVLDVVIVEYFGLVQCNGQYDGVVCGYVGNWDVCVFGVQWYVDIGGEC